MPAACRSSWVRGLNPRRSSNDARSLTCAPQGSSSMPRFQRIQIKHSSPGDSCSGWTCPGVSPALRLHGAGSAQCRPRAPGQLPGVGSAPQTLHVVSGCTCQARCWRGAVSPAVGRVPCFLPHGSTSVKGGAGSCLPTTSEGAPGAARPLPPPPAQLCHVLCQPCPLSLGGAASASLFTEGGLSCTDNAVVTFELGPLVPQLMCVCASVLPASL